MNSGLSSEQTKAINIRVAVIVTGKKELLALLAEAAKGPPEDEWVLDTKSFANGWSRSRSRSSVSVTTLAEANIVRSSRCTLSYEYHLAEV
jgi:hypothetical protein